MWVQEKQLVKKTHVRHSLASFETILHSVDHFPGGLHQEEEEETKEKAMLSAVKAILCSPSSGKNWYSSSAAVGSADYFEVDMLALWYIPANFGAKKSLV